MLTTKFDFQQAERVVPIYPNRDIPSPEPVPGRQHLFVQTDEYIENLTDKPPTEDVGIATEFYLDRPPVPLFQPKMPAKENCKATQIFDGDTELFNFDEEVEPMLNVLCLKTLEQARMEVLEEEELTIMKGQKKEYEEVRNAELIEAQRFEAAEARVAAEKSRRAIQQKARKDQRRTAHQKHVSRVMAKKYLAGIREKAVNTLSALSMMQPKLENDLHETVLPWLKNQRDAFTEDMKESKDMADKVIMNGIQMRKKAHAKMLAERAARLKKEADEIEMAGVRQQERRAERKIQRETRAKEQAKAQMRDEIRRILIDKGQVQSPAYNTELVEIHGNYEKGGKQFLGALGGQVQQIYYVINAILKVSDNEKDLQDFYAKLAEDPKSDAVKNPRNPRELMVENFFLPFFLTSIKELKAETLSFLVNPELDALFQSLKLNKNASDQYDFTRLNNEQYYQFRHAMVEQRMFNSTYQKNTGKKAMDMVLSALTMILCNKVPKGVVPFRVDTLIPKIKFVYPPRGVEAWTRTEIPKGQDQEVVVEKNTNEKAIVRILVPKRSMTQSEIAAEDQERAKEDRAESPDRAPVDGDEANAEAAAADDGASSPKKVDDQSNRNVSRLSRVPSERIIVTDQEEKALAIANRINLKEPYMVLVMNQSAAQVHRADFLDMVQNKVFDWFNDHPKIKKQIQELADEESEITDAAYIAGTCDQYTLPCLDYTVNAPDHE